MSKLYDLLSAMCGKIKKPDWNQNDPTAADYVKNRPFYADDPERPVFDAEVFVESDGGYAVTEQTLIIKTGNVYAVIFDGVRYDCVAFDMWGAPCIGNGAIAGGEIGNGEPFVCVGNFNLIYTSTSGEHTVSIKEGEVHKIDEKYLPDTVLRTTERCVGKTINVGNCTVIFGYNLATVLDEEVITVECSLSEWNQLKADMGNFGVCFWDRMFFTNVLDDTYYVISLRGILENSIDDLRPVEVTLQYSEENNSYNYIANVGRKLAYQ